MAEASREELLAQIAELQKQLGEKSRGIAEGVFSRRLDKRRY